MEDIIFDKENGIIKVVIPEYTSEDDVHDVVKTIREHVKTKYGDEKFMIVPIYRSEDKSIEDKNIEVKVSTGSFWTGFTTCIWILLFLSFVVKHVL